MVGRYFARLLGTVALVALSSSFTMFGQSEPSASQNKPASIEKSQPSQLPDAPISNGPSSPGLSPQTGQPESSSSSPATVKPRYWTNPDPDAQVTVLEDTLFRVMTNESVSTRQARQGAPLSFTLSEDVVVDGVLIIPRGATIQGAVIESKWAGTLTGSPELILKLTSLNLGGHKYPLYSYQFKVKGTSKTKPTETKVMGGAVIGAVVGSIFSGSAKGDTTAVGKLAGAGTGAAVGAGIGATVSALTPGPVLFIPAESEMDFFLASPISVVPASQKEATRLSQGLNPGGPALYVRGVTP
jgi:hypothetical protein